MTDYRVPTGTAEREVVIRKSRFIALAVPIEDRASALVAVGEARQRYPDAGHHCWAYLLGRPGDASSAGMSDDGEPAGTAGKPILNVLQHGELGDLVVVVSRYFGGIKLGAGGLVRAYGQAAQAVLEAVPSQRFWVKLEYQLLLGFEQESGLRRWLAGHRSQILELGYTDVVSARIEVPEEYIASLSDYCRAQGIRFRNLSAAGD